jgi:hypothetical protein
MSDITNEIFDLNGDALRDMSVKSRILREYRSDANPSDNDPNIVLNVRDTSEWINLNEAYLEISGLSTGTGAGGVGSSANDLNMALESPGALGLFNTARLRIANSLVESSDVYNHYNAFTKMLMNGCDDYARSIALSTGFVLDTVASANDSPYTTTVVLNGAGGVATAGDRAVTGTASTVSNPLYNSGFTLRKALFGLTAGVGASRQRQTFYVPLRQIFSFCDVSKVIKGCPIRVELVRRSLEEMVYGSGTTDPWFSITKCSLWIPIVQPSLEVLGALETQLSKGLSIPWSYNAWRTYASDASQGTERRYTFNSQTDRPLGAFLYCKIARDTATPVNQKNFNNFAFDHCNATRVSLLINGARFPYQNYEPVWGAGATQDTTRVYADLMAYLGKNKSESDTGSLINISNHRSLYSYYYFDFGSLADLPSNGGYQISVEMNLASAPAQNMTMFLTVVSDKSWNIVGGEQGLQVINQ